ncbi:MAG: hypothetical protein ACFHVJ_15800 [Aestuariibacter sp.]
MKKIFIVLLMSILTGHSALAATSGWVHEVDVSRVVVVVNGGVNVRIQPDLSDCTSQSGYGPKYASIRPDHPGLEKMYSALLAALMSKTKVSLYLGDDKCTVGEVVIGGRY